MPPKRKPKASAKRGRSPKPAQQGATRDERRAARAAVRSASKSPASKRARTGAKPKSRPARSTPTPPASSLKRTPAKKPKRKTASSSDDPQERSPSKSRLSKRGRISTPKATKVPATASASAKKGRSTTSSSSSSAAVSVPPPAARAGRPRRRAAVPKVVRGQGLKTTATVLKDNKKKTVIIAQFGGGWGSNSGDAAVLSLRKSRRMFMLDAGTGAQKIGARNFRSSERKRAAVDSDNSDFEDETGGSDPPHTIASFTHAHADHIGDLGDRQEAEKVLIGHFAGKDAGAFKKDKVAPIELTDNDETMFEWRENSRKRSQSSERISVRGNAIVPDQPPAPDSSSIDEEEEDAPDANHRSTGALISVDRGDQRIFTMYSLGDMTNAEGRPAVQEVLDNDGHTADVIKMSHHGSENNLGAIPDGIVTEDTTLIISGYTKTGVPALLRYITRTKPKKVYILINDQSPFNTIDNQLGDNARRLENHTVTRADGTEEKVISFAKDFIVTVDDNGNVTETPTWG